MSQLPTPTARGYAPVGVTQFSIFLENRVGKMLELVKAFEDSMIRINALSVHDSTDHAVLRLVSGNPNGTREVLQRQDLSFIETQIMIVCLDSERTLARMCHFLLGAELNIRFAYPLLGWRDGEGHGAVALAVDDLTLAAQILRRKDYRLLGEGDLPKWDE